MFLSGVIAVIFGMGYLPGAKSYTELFSIHPLTAIVAGAALIVSLILYIRPLKENAFYGTFATYLLTVAMIASIVITTGSSDSPLVGLWIAAGFFAGIFGWRGFALILVLVAGYDGYAAWKSLPPETIVLASVISVAPLIASFIIWHSKSTKEDARDKSYKELATELRHEASKSDTVIGAINDGVVSVDSAGVIQLINPAAQRIIGWGQNDAVGLSYKSVVKLHDRSDKPITDANDPVAKVLASNEEVHSEDFSITTEAGKKVLLSLIVSPMGAPNSGAIMVFRDMTSEKTEEREQAEFISTASHEMRTPVASIEGYLGLALNPATATVDEKARDYIQKAQASAQHLGRLFQDLLDVSKADDGRMINTPEVINLVEFIGLVTDGLRPKAEEKGLRFFYKPLAQGSADSRVVAPVYYVHVDGDHLREVVSNLVENAIKYTPAGDVIIDVTGDDNHVQVSIQDSGIGIPAEDIPHLFQKFYRVDNSDTREIGGTGLGLYLSRRLAELMGGQIKVESEYKKGSTFSLELPRIDHVEAQRLMEAATAAEELAQSQSALAPLPQPPSVPIPPQPVQQQIATPPPAPPVNQSNNVPLSQIEQNPTAYTQPRGAVQIPVRGPGEIDQP